MNKYKPTHGIAYKKWINPDKRILVNQNHEEIESLNKHITHKKLNQ